MSMCQNDCSIKISFLKSLKPYNVLSHIHRVLRDVLHSKYWPNFINFA